MDKFEEAICEHNPLYKEGLQDKYYQGAKWAWQSRQAEVDALNDNHLAYIDKVIAMESDYLEKIIEKEKRIEELTHLATELAQYASYAEIVGAISHNRQPIREFSDKIFDFNKKVEEEALRGEHE